MTSPASEEREQVSGNPSPNQKKVLAFMAGTVSGIHQEALRMDALGVEGMDMIACQAEDLFGSLRALLTDEHPESMAYANGQK